jgi:hypothetical protein
MNFKSVTVVPLDLVNRASAVLLALLCALSFATLATLATPGSNVEPLSPSPLRKGGHVATQWQSLAFKVVHCTAFGSWSWHGDEIPGASVFFMSGLW